MTMPVMSSPKFITFHCSATPNLVHYDIEKIRHHHIHTNKWNDIGYHAVIQPSGEIQWGRGLTTQGAHVSGANKDNIGICLIGTDRFTYDQLWQARHHTLAIMGAYDIPPWHIRTHYSYPSAREQGKTCPNIRIENLIMWIIWGDVRAIEEYAIT